MKNFYFRFCAWLFYVFTFAPFIKCSISINQITTRTPKDNDIGLIFDINLINTANEEKELLEFHIRPEKECCVNLTESKTTLHAGRIVGGSFGLIEPGEVKTVSLIWPTTEVFNRVGHCDIIISSTNNIKNEEKHLTQQLNFDTRFTQIDPTSTTFRKRAEYKECLNWDLNFLNNCTPVNCEEKYFGKRNFHDLTTKECETVPRCDGKNQIYDIYTNECLNSNQLMDNKEIENIKKGNYENSTLEFLKIQFDDAQIKQKFEEPIKLTISQLYLEMKGSTMWSDVINGLCIVSATIIAYFMTSFCIFLLVIWLSNVSETKI